MAALQNRLAEINALMAADNFWNNREKAQTLIDEAGVIRNKIEPLAKTGKAARRFPRHARTRRGRAAAKRRRRLNRNSPATSPGFSRNSIRSN